MREGLSSSSHAMNNLMLVMKNLNLNYRSKTNSLLRVLVFFICISFYPANNASSQTYFFDNYGVIDGLSQSKVYDVLQDDRGYLWLATAAGVSVFDGIMFRNYSAVSDGLSPGAARTLLQDSNGNIWIGHNDGGLTIFDGKDFIIPPISGNELQWDVTSFIESKGEVWITSFGSGIVRVKNPYEDPYQFIFEHYSGGSITPRIMNSYKESEGRLYFIGDRGISTYNEDENNFEPYNPSKLPVYFNVICMLEDSRNNYWFGTHNGGLYKINFQKDELKIYDIRDGLAHNMVSYLTEDSDGNIWVGTWGGGITRISDDKLKTFNTGNGLSDDMIRSIKEDFEGNILVATNENGLDIFKGERIISFDVNSGLINQQVWAVHQDGRGRYWIGTQGGISVYDPSKPAGKAFTNFQSLGGFSFERTRFIKEDRNNNLWVSTDIAGIGMYNTSRGSISSYTMDFVNRELLPRGSPNPTALEIDRNNNLWIGTNDRVSWYNIDSGENGIFTQGAGLAGNDISSLYYDSGGTLWVGSQGRGLATISENMEVTRIELGEDFTPLCMTEDSEGNIWVGTESQGVIVTDGSGIILRLDESAGLLGNYITLITSDNENIYIGSSRGLNRYNNREERLYSYTRKNGFVGIEAVRNACFTDGEGKHWFGTLHGVMVYNPYVYRDELIEPLTHVTSLRVNYLDREIKDGLKFSYRENSIIFEFNSISLNNPDAVRFRVMLDGADPDWRPVTRENSAIYPSLSPGQYRFKLMASNSQGVWNTEPVIYTFKIKPPWYASWWGITIFVITGIVAMVVYIKIREQNHVKEKRVLEDKVAERTREISEKNQLLAIKNKDITDSINYAKRLQNAILPADGLLKESFVLFRPKDIVSGDFYWIVLENGIDLVAAVDCTGHGVPGAFMSIIGHNGLNKIVREMKILKPGEILDKLNEEVYVTLHQNIELSEGVRDGMDIALIAYHRKKKKLEYSGAFNSLYLIRDGELTEYKADKFAIGSSLTENNKYTTHEIDLEKDDKVYIFSDGYADQFGGEKGKKFMSKSLKQLLLDINNLPMAEQKKILESRLVEWMGSYEQIDDVLIIGRHFQ
jgi:ligand-binding sensor domain-containing protein/serine phosphatase RsbU (regulator of sigma subunit)